MSNITHETMRAFGIGSAAIRAVASRALPLCTAALVPFLLGGCFDRQAQGFALPPGDVERGKAAFVELGCNSCHHVAGVIERNPEIADPIINVRLGGQVTRVRSYGDLVTSIMNPSHRLSRGNNPATVADNGESRMPYYNDIMTVQQLVDITQFLQGTYSLWVPEYELYYYP